MLQKWWVDQVNTMLKDTGEHLILFRSFNEALIWDALEILILIQAASAVLFFLNPLLGSFGVGAAMIATFVIMANFVRKMRHPDLNCWISPEEMKGKQS